MYSIQNYKNPYENMPLPPERIVVGPYIFEEIPQKNGKLIFPEGIDNIKPREMKPMEIVPMKTKPVKKINYQKTMRQIIKMAKTIFLIP